MGRKNRRRSTCKPGPHSEGNERVMYRQEALNTRDTPAREGEKETDEERLKTVDSNNTSREHPHRLVFLRVLGEPLRRGGVLQGFSDAYLWTSRQSDRGEEGEDKRCFRSTR